MIDCPTCRDTDELCSHTAPAQVATGYVGNAPAYMPSATLTTAHGLDAAQGVYAASRPTITNRRSYCFRCGEWTHYDADWNRIAVTPGCQCKTAQDSPRIPTMRAPWPDAPEDLAALRAELRRLAARVAALEERARMSETP